MKIILTACIQQHHLVNTIWKGKTERCAESSGTGCDAGPGCCCCAEQIAAGAYHCQIWPEDNNADGYYNL